MRRSQIDEKCARAHGSRAWLWSTCPDAKYRDGKKAVASATRACELTDWNDSALARCARGGTRRSGRFRVGREVADQGQCTSPRRRGKDEGRIAAQAIRAEEARARPRRLSESRTAGDNEPFRTLSETAPDEPSPGRSISTRSADTHSRGDERV